MPDYRGVKMTSERLQHRYVTFTQILIGSLLTLVISAALSASGDHSETGKSTFQAFLPKVYIPVLKKY